MQNQHHYILANTSIPAYKTPDKEFSMSQKTKKLGNYSRLKENNETRNKYKM